VVNDGITRKKLWAFTYDDSTSPPYRLVSRLWRLYDGKGQASPYHSPRQEAHAVDPFA